MTALSFLGLANYTPTRYKYQEQEVETHLFPVAFTQFVKPDELKVVMTQQAQEMHYATLQQKLKGVVTLTPILIPEGKSEKDLWFMFDKIVESIPNGATLAVDVTHGFRSQPILMLAICFYLRLVHDVEIPHILYGAFEARSEKTNITPVFELTPFLFLMDWTIALDKFIKLGNADELSKLMATAHQQAYHQPSNAGVDLPKKLKSLGAHIQHITQALAAIRPQETMETARSMIGIIDRVSDEVSTWAKPFTANLSRAKREYGRLISDDDKPFSTAGMKAQFNMIQWYLRKQQYVQCVTLAREWLISQLCLLKQRDPIDRDDRQSIEHMLGTWISDVKKNEPPSGVLFGIPEKDIAALFASLSDTRNDMNHAGMRKNPKPAAAVIKSIEHLVVELEQMKIKFTGK
ncbi:TIGR02221 family CRISPR-associated protein [candidate division KSB1 bacterium]|nr:TIGR02221 family CRISPR-associated protein [candidate division KSB1 bacterium]